MTLKEQFVVSFLENDRWLLLLNGLRISFTVMIGALLLGIIIGIFVAVIRTSYDQQRQGKKKSWWLSILNAIMKIYITVIRGTPMMVQLLIMGFVVFAASRNLVLIAILTLGINSGAYVSETIRSGIMSIDPGQMEAGRSLGMKYPTVMKDIIVPCDRHRPCGHHQGRGPDPGQDLPGAHASCGHRPGVSGLRHNHDLAAGQTGKEAA